MALPRECSAAVLTGPGRFEFRKFSLPALGEADGLLKVESCGICGTDYEQVRGDIAFDSYRTPYPAVPGHEPIGVIAALGKTAARRWDVTVGDRVVIRPVYGCGRCAPCRNELFGGCTSRGGTYGLTSVDKAPHLWGGFAEYMYLHEMSVVRKIDPRLDPDVATLVNALACGLSWAVTAPMLVSDEKVLILGAGQRALACVAAAKSVGNAGQVVIVGLERDAYKEPLARSLGADSCVWVRDGADVGDVISAGVAGDIDVAVDTTPFATDMLGHAVKVAAQHGRVISAGYKGRRETSGLFQDEITRKEICLRGVSGTQTDDFERAIELLGVLPGLAAIHTHSFPLREVEEAIDVASGSKVRNGFVHGSVSPLL